MKALVFSLFMILLCSLPKAMADEASYYKTKTDVEALFHMSGDLVDVKIAIDKLVDPSINVLVLRKQFDDYRAPLVTMLQAVIGDHEKLAVLRRFIYEPGPWNSYKVLAYDHDDPLAQILEHRFLGYTIDSRSGTCSTMPQLMMLLGKSIGLKMTLAFLPKHNFIKFTDDQNREWNLEATSGGGYTRESHYRKSTIISDRAVETGAYMRALSEEEAIASLAHFVGEWYLKRGRPEDAIAAYTVILRHSPKDVSAWVGRGSAHALILRREFLGKFSSMAEMTPQQQRDAIHLSEMNKHDFDQAEALGWSEQDDRQSLALSAADAQKQ
jgi:regulator of sirC expression with transglutaminase-like and TPR domain